MERVLGGSGVSGWADNLAPSNYCQGCSLIWESPLLAYKQLPSWRRVSGLCGHSSSLCSSGRIVWRNAKFGPFWIGVWEGGYVCCIEIVYILLLAFTFWYLFTDSGCLFNKEIKGAVCNIDGYSSWNGFCSPRSKYWKKLFPPPYLPRTRRSCGLPESGHATGTIAFDNGKRHALHCKLIR